MRSLLCVSLLLGLASVSQAVDLWGHFLGKYGVGINGNGWQCCKCCDDYDCKPLPCLKPPCRPWDRCVAPAAPCTDCKK